MFKKGNKDSDEMKTLIKDNPFNDGMSYLEVVLTKEEIDNFLLGRYSRMETLIGNRKFTVSIGVI